MFRLEPKKSKGHKQMETILYWRIKKLKITKSNSFSWNSTNGAIQNPKQPVQPTPTKSRNKIHINKYYDKSNLWGERGEKENQPFHWISFVFSLPKSVWRNQKSDVRDSPSLNLSSQWHRRETTEMVSLGKRRL